MVLKDICGKYNLDYKFVKFLFVGALNTSFGYFVYSLSLFAGFHYSLAAIFSTILGVLFNFKTTGTIVFKNRNNMLLFKFIGVYCITCSTNIALLKVFNMFNFNMHLAGAILVFPIAMLAFTLLRKFVFNESGVLHEKN